VYAIYKGKGKNPILEGLTLTCQQKGMRKAQGPGHKARKNKKNLSFLYDNLAPYALNHIWVGKGRLTLTWTKGPSRWNPNE
jgi:hypothetical protein